MPKDWTNLANLQSASILQIPHKVEFILKANRDRAPFGKRSLQTAKVGLTGPIPRSDCSEVPGKEGGDAEGPFVFSTLSTGPDASPARQFAVCKVSTHCSPDLPTRLSRSLGQTLANAHNRRGWVDDIHDYVLLQQHACR